MNGRASHDDWLAKKITPVLLAVGRLEEQKNYGFMLEVFKQVREKRNVRLIILGEGKERSFLENQIRELGLQDFIRMPGIKKNPYSYMANADIMLCTSLYEGFNIALAESLACGTPIISVDCPYGPAEILEDGKYGTLIPMGDSDSMVKAIIEGIDKSDKLPSKERLYQRARDFSVEKIFLDYQELISKTLSDKHH
ncbi:MAG: glycosyltransferase [Flexilinea sp.]